MSSELTKTHIKKLSDDLGLVYEAQDWGIINADPLRLQEFIHYLESQPNLLPNQVFHLGELILSSANEVLVNGGSLPEEFLAFLERFRTHIEAHLEYWTSVANEVELPLGSWLRNR